MARSAGRPEQARREEGGARDVKVLDLSGRQGDEAKGGAGQGTLFLRPS